MIFDLPFKNIIRLRVDLSVPVERETFLSKTVFCSFCTLRKTLIKENKFFNFNYNFNFNIIMQKLGSQACIVKNIYFFDKMFSYSSNVLRETSIRENLSSIFR